MCPDRPVAVSLRETSASHSKVATEAFSSVFLLRFLPGACLISQRDEMTNRALIYHRPSKWPIATALGTAVLIHLSALAIAFHREPAMTQLTASDSTIFPVDVDDEQSVPPNPNTSVPPPAPVPTSDFIERESPRPINTHQNLRPFRRPAQTRVTARSNGKIFALSAPQPDYPYEARSRHLTGSGIAIISVDPITGFASDVTMEQSIGNPILDNSTVSAFRRWRFKPGSPSRVRIPITFLLTGAQY